MWQMIGVLGELERSLISERTRAGRESSEAPRCQIIRKETQIVDAADRPRPEAACNRDNAATK
jgi:DNA invertase Pin-like site-specific DNA recombinase